MSETLEVVCPECDSKIDLKDVNVADDIVLCRKCVRNFSYAEAVGEREDSDEAADVTVDLTRPPEGVWYKRTPNGFELGSTTRSRAAAFFLVPFMVIWSGGSIGGIYGSQIGKGEFDLVQSLFGLPFLFGTVVLGCFAVLSLWGKYCVRAEGKQGELFVGAGSFGYRKKFQWDQVKDIRLQTKRTAKGGRYRQILIDAERPVTIFHLNEERLNYVLGALRQLHRQFSARPVPPKFSEAA